MAILWPASLQRERAARVAGVISFLEFTSVPSMSRTKSFIYNSLLEWMVFFAMGDLNDLVYHRTLLFVKGVKSYKIAKKLAIFP
jgi:hypothetical protein